MKKVLVFVQGDIGFVVKESELNSVLIEDEIFQVARDESKGNIQGHIEYLDQDTKSFKAFVDLIKTDGSLSEMDTLQELVDLFQKRMDTVTVDEEFCFGDGEYCISYAIVFESDIETCWIKDNDSDVEVL